VNATTGVIALTEASNKEWLYNYGALA